jgi:hypothetical protein
MSRPPWLRLDSIQRSDDLRGGKTSEEEVALKPVSCGRGLCLYAYDRSKARRELIT